MEARRRPQFWRVACAGFMGRRDCDLDPDCRVRELTRLMPIIIKLIDHEHNELEAVAFGPIDYAEVEKHLLQERNLDGLAYKEFIDARDAGLVFAISPNEIRQIVALVRTLSKRSKLGPTAVLVSTDFAFGIMSAMEMLVEDVTDVRTFRQERLARSWLASTADMS